MACRKVNDNSLASVANAIRPKGGTSDAIVFPDGFVSAISAIQTGVAAIVIICFMIGLIVKATGINNKRLYCSICRMSLWGTTSWR